MVRRVKFEQLILFLGDLVTLYAALFAMLIIRYGEISAYQGELHLTSFTILFALWLIIFYIAGLYDLNELKNNADFRRRSGFAFFIAFLVAIAFFYFIPSLGITPKTNLFLFLALFGAIAYAWRTFYNNAVNRRAPIKKILLVGTSAVSEKLAAHLSQNPQLGYEIKSWIKGGAESSEFSRLSEIILENTINLIVIPAHVKKNSQAARLIYKNLALGIEVMDLAELYEIIFHKVPLAELEEVWFLENLAKSRTMYDALLRPIEIIFVLVASVVALPLAAAIALITKMTSSGSAFFTQIRVGKNGTRFTLWKFRTMGEDAEKYGPRWAKPNDQRVTPFGKILRRTHLDELPQLWNILRGELSLVGPRPERPEFVATLQKEIPFYDLRHLVRPGLTGWAQLNYRYGASLDEAYQKLQYDIYYLKHRSISLDIGIVLKTARRFFSAAS